MSLGQSYTILGCSRKSGRKSQGKLQLCEASRLKTHQLEYSFCIERARSCLSTHFRSHREGVCGQKHMSIHFRAVLHSWAEDTQLGQDFVAARCLPVCDIEGNEWKTTVAGFRSIDNAELQSQLSCPPNPTQNALRGHQLAQPGHRGLHQLPHFNRRCTSLCVRHI